jgi:hypothetical protein
MTGHRTPLINNWKTAAEAQLVAGIRDNLVNVRGVEVLICPPVQLLFPGQGRRGNEDHAWGTERP